MNHRRGLVGAILFVLGIVLGTSQNAFAANTLRVAQVQRIPPPTGAGSFGFSVATCGLSTLVGDPNSGQAFMYRRGATGALASVPEYQIGLPGPVSKLEVAVTCDAAAVVGATGSGIPGTAHYLERHPNGTWLASSVSTLSGQPGDDMGWSVAIGSKTDTAFGPLVVVGAPGADNGRGRAYFWLPSYPLPAPPTIITAPVDAVPGDRFGETVAIGADAEGHKVVLVGAPRQENARGAVYLFSISNIIPLQFLFLGKLQPESMTAGNLFGQAISMSEFGGPANAVVGAPALSLPTQPGFARLYNLPAPSFTASVVGFAPDAFLGWHVALDGDVAVIATQNSFRLFSPFVIAGWQPRAPAISTSSVGPTVAIRGDRVFVGTPNEPGGGALYEYALEPSQLLINEVDYEQPGIDDAEFIELKNVSSASANLSEYSVELVDPVVGGVTVYRQVQLPPMMLPSGAYFVICGNPSTVAKCDLDLSPDTDLIHDGHSGVGLRFRGTLVGGTTNHGFISGYSNDVSSAPYDMFNAPMLGVSRCANTGLDGLDFVLKRTTPGSANDCSPQPAPVHSTPLLVALFAALGIVGAVTAKHARPSFRAKPHRDSAADLENRKALRLH